MNSEAPPLKVDGSPEINGIKLYLLLCLDYSDSTSPIVSATVYENEEDARNAFSDIMFMIEDDMDETLKVHLMETVASV